jgi:hypothetical protein
MAILGAAPNAALTDLEMNRVGAAAASAGSTKGHDSREEHEWRPFSSLKLRGLRAETVEIASVVLAQFSREEGEHDRVAAPPARMKQVRSKDSFAPKADLLGDSLRCPIVGVCDQFEPFHR